ncbi:hypothetical protein L207DRAFT_576802 [Hyaloscypha variabilis F]|uniref:Extracellular membrane protein CFEM domain-containing protein n=1 Tax=Hyaloscypha variabilis (strain UAMH 11265 / GT02V1 / F) TaxID=1149755 RepID=A0A2J6S585_HYAVF|nr:hypothetical protein L207DRAFT_576802 [Hyaloscypha variabilis F]
MHTQTLLLAVTASLIPLATSIACVAGGPADQVAAANTCCTELTGTWHGTQSAQGICVLPDWASFWWNLCVDEIPGSAGVLDTRCIPGNGTDLDGSGSDGVGSASGSGSGGDLTLGGAGATSTSSGEASTLTLGPGV